jgi:hypothetical protein
MGKTVDELRVSVSTIILLLVSSAFIGRILYDGRYGLSGVYAALTVSPEKQPSYYYKYLFIYYYCHAVNCRPLYDLLYVEVLLVFPYYS